MKGFVRQEPQSRSVQSATATQARHFHRTTLTTALQAREFGRALPQVSDAGPPTGHAGRQAEPPPTPPPAPPPPAARPRPCFQPEAAKTRACSHTPALGSPGCPSTPAPSRFLGASLRHSAHPRGSSVPQGQTRPWWRQLPHTHVSPPGPWASRPAEGHTWSPRSNLGPPHGAASIICSQISSPLTALQNLGAGQRPPPFLAQPPKKPPGHRAPAGPETPPASPQTRSLLQAPNLWIELPLPWPQPPKPKGRGFILKSSSSQNSGQLPPSPVPSAPPPPRPSPPHHAGLAPPPLHCSLRAPPSNLSVQSWRPPPHPPHPPHCCSAQL